MWYGQKICDNDISTIFWKSHDISITIYRQTICSGLAVINSRSQPKSSHGDGKLCLVPTQDPQWAAKNPDEGLSYNPVKFNNNWLMARGVHSVQDEHDLWQGQAWAPNSWITHSEMHDVECLHKLLKIVDFIYVNSDKIYIFNSPLKQHNRTR